MQNFNQFVLNFTISIIDYLYRGRPFQRFWVLEEIARAPYFAFLSVLHLRESMGLRGPEHIYLMEEHFAQTLNETEHLEYMESRGGSAYWVDLFRQTPRTYLLLGQRGLLLGGRAAYHLSYEIEIHAATTYAKYLADYGHDDKILEILNDELHHSKELKEAMEMIP